MSFLTDTLKGYTNLVDKVTKNKAFDTAVGVLATSTGIPGMDKILMGVEKLIPDGGIDLAKKKKVTPKVPTRSTTSTNVSRGVAGVNENPDVVPFDWKQWSTYPSWAKWTIYIVVPAGMIFGVWEMMKKNKVGRF